MKTIFRLTHSYEDEQGYDIVTEIAVYSSLEKATKAKEKFMLQPHFSSHPEGFEIVDFKLNQCFWQDGFVPVDSD